MDSAGYLRRFFDMQLRIPSPSLRNYVEYIVDDSLLTENSMLDTTIEDIRNNIRDIFDKLNLTLRDINIVYNNFLIFVRYHNMLDQDNAMQKFYLYLFLISIKYKNPRVYQVIFSKKYSTGTINNEIDKIEYRFNNISVIGIFLDYFSMGNMQTLILELDTGKIDFLNSVKLLDYETDERVHQFLERQLEFISIVS